MSWDAAARKAQYNKEWYDNNREKCLGYAKTYRDKNVEKCRADARKWRKNNPEKALEYARKYTENKRIKKAYDEWNNTLRELGYFDLIK